VYIVVLTLNTLYFFRGELPQPRPVVSFRLAEFIDLPPYYIRVVTLRAVDWIGKEAQLQRYSYAIKFQKLFGTQAEHFL
jgi:hypothetical protein